MSSISMLSKFHVGRHDSSTVSGSESQYERPPFQGELNQQGQMQALAECCLKCHPVRQAPDDLGVTQVVVTGLGMFIVRNAGSSCVCPEFVRIGSDDA